MKEERVNTNTTTTLLCPKCHAPMRSYERSGVTIDRCTECGGIFLDRGELEHLMRAENEYEARVDRDDREYRPERDDRRYRDDDDDDDRRTYGNRPYKKKRKNFLEDLFDFG
jgi:Zn-finger nucleic acid-binding protein